MTVVATTISTAAIIAPTVAPTLKGAEVMAASEIKVNRLKMVNVSELNSTGPLACGLSEPIYPQQAHA